MERPPIEDWQQDFDDEICYLILAEGRLKRSIKWINRLESAILSEDIEALHSIAAEISNNPERKQGD